MEIGNQSVDYRPLILVAEDDDSNFKLIKAIIGKRCEIMWAKNGEEIVSLFHENRDKTDAILMDIKMPIMNGLEATRLIREEGGTLPIIMQTAYAFSADRENAIKSGASEVFVEQFPAQAEVVGSRQERDGILLIKLTSVYYADSGSEKK